MIEVIDPAAQGIRPRYSVSRRRLGCPLPFPPGFTRQPRNRAMATNACYAFRPCPTRANGTCSSVVDRFISMMPAPADLVSRSSQAAEPAFSGVRWLGGLIVQLRGANESRGRQCNPWTARKRCAAALNVKSARQLGPEFGRAMAWTLSPTFIRSWRQACQFPAIA